MKNLAEIRSDFPILTREVNGKPLVYLDNGASTQKPQAVIDVISKYYSNTNANVHRGVHALSGEATDAMEAARKSLQKLINAPEDREVLFTSGTTHSINILAHAWGAQHLQEGDEVILSEMEHHSNIVPWQMVCERVGAIIKVVPVTDQGELDMVAYKDLLSDRTKMVSIMHVSNALGTVNPVHEIITAAHAAGALVHIDGAQAIAHMPVDVQALDCDFYCFSGHKLFAPTGTGVLYGKAYLLEDMDPLFGGGEMIKSVSFSGTTYNEIPFKFEAGTPNIAGNIGLGAAAEYVMSLDWKVIREHEEVLLSKCLAGLRAIPGMRIVGAPKERSGAISFLVGDIHPFDLGILLDKLGIAVRTGHHCTEPLMHRFGIPGTVRASFAMYNSEQDVDALIAGLERVVPMLS